MTRDCFAPPSDRSYSLDHLNAITSTPMIATPGLPVARSDSPSQWIAWSETCEV